MGALPTEDTESLSEYAALLVGRIKAASKVARKNIGAEQSGYLLRGNEKRIEREYKISKDVLFVHDSNETGAVSKLVSHLFGPYRIINRKFEHNYEIDLISKKARGKNGLVVHVKRLK